MYRTREDKRLSAKQRNDKNNKRHLNYKGKSVFLKSNPRTGICSECHRKRLTQMHHYGEYIDSDPLANTIELCVPCHAKKKNRKSVPTDRICCKCLGGTYVDKRGYSKWMIVDKEKGLFQCNKCYCRFR